MAPRPAWKGYLKLSLVTCAIELSNAVTESEKISFHILNRKTGHKMRRQYIDAEHGKPVPEKDEVKGYEVDKGKFLLIEEEEIEGVQIEILAHAQSRDLRQQARYRADLPRHPLLRHACRRGIGRGIRGHPRSAGGEEDGGPGAHRVVAARAAGDRRAL